MSLLSTCILQKVAETQSGIDVTQTWEDLWEFKAVLDTLTMNERAAPFNKETVFATHRLIIRARAISKAYAAELKEKNRIRIGTTIYDIQGVNDYHGRHYEVELLEVT